MVTCLAAMLEFDACGIEIEEELVAAAQQLADDFTLPIQFIRGSFIPDGSGHCFLTDDGFVWLNTDDPSGWKDLDLDPADFDVIFAYPWPDEDEVVGTLFECHARVGALLLTYHDGGTIRLRRKVKRK